MSITVDPRVTDRIGQLADTEVDGVWIYELAGEEAVTRFMNARGAGILGYDRPEELLERRVMDLVPASEHASARSRLEDRRRGISQVAVLPLRRKDGSTVWVSLRSLPLTNAAGVVDAILVLFNDASIAHAADVMRSRLAAIVDSSYEAIFTVTAQGVISSWNRAAERLFGYSAREAIGAPQVMLVPPDLREEYDASLRDVLRGASVQYETRRRRRDGEDLYVSVSCSPVCDDTGTVVEVSKVIRDLTKEKRLDEQLRQASKMEAIGRLAGGVAHDFNNLLSVILSYAVLALDGVRKEDPVAGDLREIQSAGQRAAELTKQLLAFSRQQVLQPAVFELRRTVTSLRGLLERLVGEHIDLRFTVPPNTGCVFADPTQIEQVIMNLVVNARDAMPKGGTLTIETGSVELDAAYASAHEGVRPGPYVVLAVSDTGVGMDDKTMARVFEPFFTTKERGKGTGLGLSTVYGIVKQSGGHIWVYSEPGKGTVFKVYFPRTDLPVTAASTLPPTDDAPLDGEETILLVEDDDQVRQSIASILSRHGYNVLAAKNGGEALLLCEERRDPIHLMVTDVVMPLMGGPKLVDRVRKIRPEIPVLYISGYTESAIVHEGIVEAGVAFLSKPIMPDALLRKVREIVAKPRNRTHSDG